MLRDRIRRLEREIVLLTMQLNMSLEDTAKRVGQTFRLRARLRLAADDAAKYVREISRLRAQVNQTEKNAEEDKVRAEEEKEAEESTEAEESEEIDELNGHSEGSVAVEEVVEESK